MMHYKFAYTELSAGYIEVIANTEAEAREKAESMDCFAQYTNKAETTIGELLECSN